MNTIVINTDAEWEKIRHRHDDPQLDINVVVDPMVFRTADVFLQGLKPLMQSRELIHPASRWNAISSNIGSLCTFFDLLILEGRLPMYDYDTTFPPDIQTGKNTLVELCNDAEDVLVPVTVRDEAYQEMKRAAVTALGGQPEIPEATAADILTELSAFDWEWRPDLWRDEKIEDNAQERVLDAFRYGGLLFSGYTRRTGTDHILQPKRARLYLAASLGAQRASDEKALFAELTRLANEAPEGVLRTGDLPPMPTFLPYLLKSDPKTPRELLERALGLRKSGVVGEYRWWRRAVIDDIDKGRVLTKRRKELAQIAAAILRELRIESDSTTKVSAKVSAKVVGPIPVPEVGGEVGVEMPVRLGWLLRHIPGYRYRKLLMRMVIAQQEYVHIDKHLKRIWEEAD